MSATPQLVNRINQALTHHKAGRLDQAEALYRQARPLAPRYFEVWHLSGLLAYQQQRMTDAADFLGRALKLKPDAIVCQYQLAMALVNLRQSAAAERHLRHVVNGKPDYHEAWEALAFALKTQDKLDEAVQCHERAVALKPKAAESWYNFGLTLSLLGRSRQALACHDKALEADPAYANGYFGRAQALHQSDRIAEAVAEYERFLQRMPDHHEARSYRLFALHNLDGISRDALFAEHVEFGRRVGAPIRRTWKNSRDPERRLRVAILSPDFREHSCAYFIEPLLRHLDRERFELFLYHDHFRQDAMTDRFSQLATVWRNFVGQSHGAVEKVILEDAPDLMIDLAGHTGMTNRMPLFARRLAPVQINYLGYPNTSGVAAMDYRFTDATADPAGEADSYATERLVRFAPTAWCFQPAASAPSVAPRPSVSSGAVTFGCFNAPAKITDAMLRVWARILAAAPNARLLLKGQGFHDPELKALFLARAQGAGIPATELELVGRTPDTAAHLAIYHRVDVALDTFPYHGTTTTCEAMWMGVPVVSLAGDRHVSRVGASLLTAVGHPEWIARDADEYVRRAVDVAANPEALAQASMDLRVAMQKSPLLDQVGQALRFGDALRNCWRCWCETPDAK